MHFENMIDPEQRNVTVNELLEYLKRIYEIILQESYPGQLFIQELQRIWPSEHWNIEKVRLLYERNDVAPLKRLRFSKGMKLPKSADWIRCESEYKGEKRYTPANISFLLTSLNPFRYDCVELRYDDAANVRWFGKLMLLIVHPYENTVVGCLIETYQDVYNYSLDSTSLSHVDTGSSKQSSRLRSLDKVDEDPDFVLQRKKKKQKTHKASEGQKKAREGEGKHRCTHGPEEMYRILKCPVVLELSGVIDLVAKEDILRRILLVPDFSSNLKKDGTWGRYFVDRFNHLTRKAFEIEEQF